jgi:hypothetical protein
MPSCYILKSCKEKVNIETSDCGPHVIVLRKVLAAAEVTVYLGEGAVKNRPYVRN